eukprot:NODE_402_length_1697_cov_269.851335_g321_i0.p1 GENE.NODE_402_length_1697_cov_269.851335_g321_i0~~NODE_402_length_1697_cov_269.851335_g321_i0.p1  ORF type:complete len:449 (+),score=117.85 NODE_402_length_1697_cov_269.851335_g321_i0:73-1419(+)
MINVSEIQEQLSKWDSKRYKLESAIGRGSYGTVLQAIDTITDKRVAIKSVSSDIFKDGFLAHRIMLEIAILGHFRHHPNLVGLLDIIRPPPSEFNAMFIVMPMFETDLKSLFKAREPLTAQHVKFFMIQLLRAVKYMHDAGVMHRDLTPANVLLNISCDLAICDFGLARTNPQASVELTDYVVMRWYRAPELVMEDTKYGPAVDMWAVGAIFGQFFRKDFLPVFPGTDRIRQLGAILKIIGTPPSEEIIQIGSATAQKYLHRHYGNLLRVDFNTHFQLSEGGPLPADAMDLLKRLLRFAPNRRINASEAIIHPWLMDYREYGMEQAPPLPFVMDLEVMTTEDVKKLKPLIFDKVTEIRRMLNDEGGALLSNYSHLPAFGSPTASGLSLDNTSFASNLSASCGPPPNLSRLPEGCVEDDSSDAKTPKGPNYPENKSRLDDFDFNDEADL